MVRFMELTGQHDVASSLRAARRLGVADQRDELIAVLGPAAQQALLPEASVVSAATALLQVYGVSSTTPYSGGGGSSCLDAAAAAAVLGDPGLLSWSSPSPKKRSSTRTGQHTSTPDSGAAAAATGASGDSSDSEGGAGGVSFWGSLLRSLTGGGRVGLRGPVSDLATAVWQVRGDKDHFTGATRERVEGVVGGIQGAPQVDHIVEVSLLESILMNAAVSAGSDQWAGGVLDEWEAEQLLQRLKEGAPLHSGKRTLRSTVRHRELMFAATNDSAHDGDGWRAGQGNLNVTHQLANLTKKGMFRRYKLDVLSLHPDSDERHISDTTAAGLDIVTQWDAIVETTGSDLPAYLRAAGLNARDVTRSVRACIRDATQSLSSRLDRMYERLELDAASEAHSADVALLEALQRELLAFRRLGGLR